MAGKEPTFTLGIEEEYLLVDRETRGLVIDPPQTLMAEAEEKCGPQVTSEFLQSQIEIGTKVCANIQEAHEDLAFTIFADSHQLPFDSEGRIILPPALVEHAGIGERAGFVGMGGSFQIWEPETLAQQKAEARARARAQGLTLPLRRGPGDAK